MTISKAKLNKIEEKIARGLQVDPQEAIQTIKSFIDLAHHEKEEIPDEEKITRYNFTWWVNEFLSHDDGQNKQERSELWRDIEKRIDVKKGFRKDNRDNIALEIRDF